MPLTPWDYAAKTRTEHAEQVALFMWANMARLVGPEIANDPLAYTIPGYAKTLFDRSQEAHDISGKNARPMPELKWLHAIHNQGVDAGKAGAIRGARAKAEGVVAGVADVSLPVPKSSVSFDRVFNGFYIELKRKDGGKPSAEQLEFQTDMRAAGYKAEIIHGWELARDAILEYLGRT